MAIINLKNLIIGGDFSMNPWQRGTSFTSVADGDYTADMFKYEKTGTMVHNIEKTANAPTAPEAGLLGLHSLKFDVTNAQASLGASDFSGGTILIEGYDAIYAMEIDFELHFWVRATKAGIYSVSVSNNGEDRSIVKDYTIGSANTWEYKVLAFPPSPSAGSWNYTNGIGLRVHWSQGAGSSLVTANPDVWQTGNFKASTNQVNAVDSTANEYQITLISLKPACHVGSFEIETRESVLAKCQRYYERSYEVDTASGTATTTGAEKMVVGAGDTSIKSMTTNFKVSKRAAPTVTTFDDAGNSGKIQLIGHANNITPGSVVPSENNVVVSSPSGDSHTGILYQYEADASL